jgi:hypothetical protein
MQRCSSASRAGVDEKETRTLLASAIIDLVNAGEWRLASIVDEALAVLAVAQNISRRSERN